MDYKTIRELCEEYRFTRAAILKWINSGKLKSLRVGTRHRILLTDWQDFLRTCNTE
jgi:excisionase family DNA binding protein